MQITFPELAIGVKYPVELDVVNCLFYLDEIKQHPGEHDMQLSSITILLKAFLMKKTAQGNGDEREGSDFKNKNVYNLFGLVTEHLVYQKTDSTTRRPSPISG